MKIIKPILRLLLRIPYFYYWSWVKWPYDFELWLSLYLSRKLAKMPLDNLKMLVPKSYVDFAKKYPNFKPFSPELRVLHIPREKGVFYHYEEGNGVTSSDKPGEPVTVTINPKPDPTDW